MAGAVPSRAGTAGPGPADCRPAPSGAAAGGASHGTSDVQRIVRYDALLQLIGEIQRERELDAVARIVATRFMHCAGVLAWRLLAVSGVGGIGGIGGMGSVGRGGGREGGDSDAGMLLIAASRHRAEVSERPFGELPAWDRRQWARRLPALWSGAGLAALRSRSPTPGDAEPGPDPPWPVIDVGVPGGAGLEVPVGAALDAQPADEDAPPLPAPLADPAGTALVALPVHQGDQTLAMFCALVGPEPLRPLDRKFVGLVASALAERVHAILTERRLAAELVAAERRALEVRHAAVLRRLVNGVAHELNTPLGVQIAACDSLARMLGENADAEQLVDTVWLVERQARHAAAIVRRLKKVSAAMQGAAPARLALTETLAEIVDVHDGGRTALHAEVDGPAGLVLPIDRLALVAVVDELLDNVRDFAHAERRLRLRVRPDEVSGTVEVDVEDDGPGLDRLVQQRYFEPFGAGERRPGHLGLGGYIVQSLTHDALGGEARIRSALGRGTCVTLRLPDRNKC